MKNIRVGFDLSQTAFSGGVGRYTEYLATELQSITGLEMIYFYSSLRQSYHGRVKNVREFKIPPTFSELIFNRLRVLNIESFVGKIDVYHSSDWTQPKTRAKKITTYHDLVPIKYPAWSDPKLVAVHKRRLELVEQEIDMVIAVSKSTMRDLLEVSTVPAEKIRVIYEGVGGEFKPQAGSEVEKFRQKMKLPEKFILAIGGVGKRRNLDRVREAVKGYHLVITGQTIPQVHPEQMPLLYAASSLLLYPSLYEGFGLPVLEAQAVGTPVITSNAASLPEVAGKAALYVDPESVGAISKAVQKLMDDQGLQNQLTMLGLENAKKFSWQRCADQTAEAYRLLMS